MRRGFSILVDTTVCLKASRDLLRRDHICQRAFLRFFFQIQLSRLARVPPMLVHAARALSRSSLLPRESRGLFFSSRSIVRPTRRFVPFLFFLPFFFFFPSLLFYFLSSSSFVPPAHNSSALCLTKQWHKGPAGLTRRAGSLREQLARILPQFLQYLLSKNRWKLRASGVGNCTSFLFRRLTCLTISVRW